MTDEDFMLSTAILASRLSDRDLEMIKTIIDGVVDKRYCDKFNARMIENFEKRQEINRLLKDL